MSRAPRRSPWERLAAAVAVLALCSACATSTAPAAATPAQNVVPSAAPSAAGAAPSVAPQTLASPAPASPGPSVAPSPSSLVRSPVPSVSPGAASGPLKTVVQALPVASIGYAAAYVAQAMGYYQQEGLDVQTPSLNSDAAVAGLLNGDVQFAVAGSGLRAAMAGAPLKAVLFSYDKDLFELMAPANIQTIQDLKGKVVGTSARGATEEVLTDIFLKQAGLNPDTDVTYLTIGTNPLGALLGGSVQAMMMNPDLAAEARAQGYHDLVDLQTVGNAHPTPFAGFVTSDSFLQSNPDTVTAWARAYVHALQYMHDDPTDAAAIIAQALQIDPSVAQVAVTDADSEIDPNDYGGFTQQGFDLLTQDNLAAAGGSATVTNIDSLVNLGPLRQAQQQLGFPCDAGYQCQ